jgi:hypothetical protein
MERKENIKVSDLVLLMDGNYGRGQWPLACVVEVFPSKDGLVRSVNKFDCGYSSQTSRTRRDKDDKDVSYSSSENTVSVGDGE